VAKPFIGVIYRLSSGARGRRHYVCKNIILD